jgi:hypothetical protein
MIRIAIATLVCCGLALFLGYVVAMGLRTGKIRHSDSSSFIVRARIRCILGSSRDISNFGRAVLNGLAACRCGRQSQADSGLPTQLIRVAFRRKSHFSLLPFA